MLTGCITDKSAGHLARMAIKRMRIFETAVTGDDHSELMNEWWKEKHGHTSTLPKPQSRRRAADPNEKYCNGCERDRDKKEFNVDRSRRDGLSNRCRECGSKQWLKANHRLCDSCGGWCVGNLCRRCMTVQIRVRDAEYDVISTIPTMMRDADRDLEEFMKSLSPNLSRSERLNILIARVCGI